VKHCAKPSLDGVAGAPVPIPAQCGDDGRDLAHLGHQLVELFGEEGLHAVRESLVGLVVDLDDEAVAPARRRAEVV